MAVLWGRAVGYQEAFRANPQPQMHFKQSKLENCMRRWLGWPLVWKAGENQGEISSGKIALRFFYKLHPQTFQYGITHLVPSANCFMLFIAEFCLPAFLRFISMLCFSYLRGAFRKFCKSIYQTGKFFQYLYINKTHISAELMSA